MQRPEVVKEIAVVCTKCGTANHWTGLASDSPLVLPANLPGDTDRCACGEPLTYDRERALIREMPQTPPPPPHSCNIWLYGLEPRQPRDGRFTERRGCPTCSKEYVVTFQGERLLQSKYECSIVGADEV